MNGATSSIPTSSPRAATRATSRRAGSTAETSASGRAGCRPRGAAAGALMALLVPKCPLCLAAYLSFLGAAASAVVWLRPVGAVLTVAGVALAAWRYFGRIP